MLQNPFAVSSAVARPRETSPPRRRSSDFAPRRGWVPTLAITVGVALLDWTTKAAVAAAVPLGAFHEVWHGRIALWHVRNHAMMLGLWGDLALPSRKLIALSASLLALLILFEIIGRGNRLPRAEQRWVWVFVGLAFGGMLGNLGERAIHWGVTDYLSFAWGDLWLPPGNVADLALFLSFPLAVPVIVFELRARSRRRVLRPASAAQLPIRVEPTST